MTYAEAIKKLRMKMMLTQTEFAGLLGVSFGTVNRWESGKFLPTMKIKRKIINSTMWVRKHCFSLMPN